VAIKPILSKTPDPVDAAMKWTELLEKHVGANQRVSRSTANRLRKEGGEAALFADNVDDYLSKTGKDSVQTDIFIKSARENAKAEFVNAAKNGNPHASMTNASKLSIPEGKKNLHANLRDDFLYMRGHLRVSEESPPTRPNHGEAIEKIIGESEWSLCDFEPAVRVDRVQERVTNPSGMLQTDANAMMFDMLGEAIGGFGPPDPDSLTPQELSTVEIKKGSDALEWFSEAAKTRYDVSDEPVPEKLTKTIEYLEQHRDDILFAGSLLFNIGPGSSDYLCVFVRDGDKVARVTISQAE